MSDPAAELEALLNRCAPVSRPRWGRLRATGKDFLGLAHRLSTGAVKDLAVGSARETVLTTAKGRIVARLVLARGLSTLEARHFHHARGRGPPRECGTQDQPQGRPAR